LVVPAGRYGAVQLVLDNYLEHDVIVAVRTRLLIARVATARTPMRHNIWHPACECIAYSPGVCRQVSQYTRDIIIEAADKVDAALGTCYAAQLARRVTVSYPPIDGELWARASIRLWTLTCRARTSKSSQP
jgi:hypothetical protein